LIIPPQLGYGQNKLDDIPINSILVFEIKIEGVK
jgi:FKBP-type peptidyl-prolyl cis-trans isomerase